MDTRQKRTHQDNATADSQIGKEYFVRCPNDKRYFRTIYIRRNPMTGLLQSHLTPAVMGEPPEGIPEIPPLMRSKLMSMNNALPHTY